MVKIKDISGVVIQVDSQGKTTQGLCDKCNKRIKYNYVIVDNITALWVVRCICGYLNISEVKL